MSLQESIVIAIRKGSNVPKPVALQGNAYDKEYELHIKTYSKGAEFHITSVNTEKEHIPFV